MTLRHNGDAGRQKASKRRDKGSRGDTSDTYLRAMFETVIDGIVLIDSHGIIEAFNPAAERMFGYTADEVRGENVKMLMPEPYRNEHDGYIENYLATGEAKIIGIGREVTARRKDGTEFHCDLAITEMSANGDHRFVGILRDITDRKAAENALRASEEHFQTLARYSPVGIFEADSDLKDTFVNQRWCEINGLSEDEGMGRGWENAVHPADRERVIREWQEARQAHSPIRTEYRYQRPDGTVTWVLVHGTWVRNSDGEVSGCVGSATDITELKEALALIAQQSQSLRELTTPVIQVWDEIVLLPLIGIIDTRRAQQIAESLLTAIVDTESRIAIIDVTGVAIIDTMIAQHLIRLSAAAKMLGAEALFTGISPEIAQTLTKINVRFEDGLCCGTLRTGVAKAFALLGKDVIGHAPADVS